MFYMCMFYVSEYTVLTFFKVLKEKDNSCNFPRMVKNNPLPQKAQHSQVRSINPHPDTRQ